MKTIDEIYDQLMTITFEDGTTMRKGQLNACKDDLKIILESRDKEWQQEIEQNYISKESMTKGDKRNVKLKRRVEILENTIKNLKHDNVGLYRIIEAHNIKVSRGCSCFKDDCGCFEHNLRESVNSFISKEKVKEMIESLIPKQKYKHDDYCLYRKEVKIRNLCECDCSTQKYLQCLRELQQQLNNL